MRRSLSNIASKPVAPAAGGSTPVPDPPDGYTQIFNQLALPVTVDSNYQTGVRHYDEPNEAAGGIGYQLLQLGLGGSVVQSAVQYDLEFYYDNPNMYVFASNGLQTTVITDESYTDRFTALQAYFAANSGISGAAPTDVGLVSIWINNSAIAGGLPADLAVFQEIAQKLSTGEIDWVSVWGAGGFEP